MTANRVIDKHSELTELDYASAGHTGFASSSDLTTTSGTLQTDIDTKLENIVEDTTPQLGGDLGCGGYNLDNVGKFCSSSIATQIYNDTGSTLTKGTAVTICGLNGEICTVCVTDNREVTKMPCCGIIHADITNGNEGCGIRLGRLNMNTSEMAGNEGDRLYVQSDGSLDTIIPTSGMVQRVGFLVVKASGNAGRICVCIRGPRSMYSAKDQHPIIRMGNDAGHKKIVFKDYTNNEVAALDNNGNLTLSGTVDDVDIATFKSDYDNHTHDDLYYMETEVDNLLTTLSGNLSNEIDSDIFIHSSSGDHDGRYYTEVEVDTISGSLNTKIDGKVSDTAYADSWDGVINIAPSKNAIYDNMELIWERFYKGYIIGGWTGTAVAVIEDLIFSNETSQAIVATLDTAKYGPTGVNSSSKGYIMGGYTTNYTAVIEDLIFSSETSQTIAATLDTAKVAGTGVNSSSKGYIMGGNTGSRVVVIEDLIFSNETSQAIVATLDTIKSNATGVNSSSKGYIMGGLIITNVIEDLIFSNETSQAIVATLDTAKSQAAGVNSSSKGYIMGGYTTNYTAVIEDLIFSNETSQTIVATLDTAKYGPAGVNSSIKGFAMGGWTGTAVAVIEDLIFSNETSQAIVATLDTEKRDGPGVQYGYV